MQRIARRTLGPSLVRLTADSGYDLRETLVVAGSPRSGTTWLAEVLASLPRSAILFEPEHVLQVPEARRSGLDWHVMKMPGEAWAEGERYFERALRGRIVTPWTVSHLPLARAVAPRRWIVKFVDANLMLGWLAARFPVKAPVLVLRHPCAVIGSQLRRGWKLDHAPRLKAFFDHYPQFREYVASLTDQVEWMAAHWCMHTYAPLALPRPWPFLLTTYESAAKEPEREFGRLFEAWRIPMPDDLAARAARPSGTADRGSRFISGTGAGGGWRRQFDDSQVKRILRVVNAFGLDFYAEDRMPDVERLQGPQALGPANLG